MSVIARILSVAITGAVAGGFAIPAGFVLKLHPVTTFTAATVGAVIATSVLLLGGGAVRDRLVEKMNSRTTKQNSRMRRFVERHGARGLGLVGPIFPGVTPSCVLGLAMGVDARALAVWISLGTAILHAVYTTAIWAALALL